jgi:hypothetical protein
MCISRSELIEMVMYYKDPERENPKQIDDTEYNPTGYDLARLITAFSDIESKDISRLEDGRYLSVKSDLLQFAAILSVLNTKAGSVTNLL